MARLSTHVLDTSRGIPARGVSITLHHLRGDHRELVASASTNTDGRTDHPLIDAERLETGIYELVFRAGDYFRAAGQTMTTPPFLEDIVVRFGVSDAEGTYHVPLLLSPYGYSTYRGS
ncbi:MAG: hydroxyisourate hydrolase [Vicinamibacterales bacterium]